jgi:cephalosporin hydroxylase
MQQERSHANGIVRMLMSVDSHHTHEHVLAELNAYADLVSIGSYSIVFDTTIKDLPAGYFPDRFWESGNRPKTAFHE